MLDNFLPSTPTEFALLNQIKILERKLYVYEMDARLRSRSFELAPVEHSLGGSAPPRITLEMTADLVANIDQSGLITVKANGMSKDKIVGATYTESVTEFSGKSTEAANAAAMIHERFVRNLADALDDGHF